MSDMIIVGSGASATAAALALADLGVRPLVLDVGHTDPGAVPVVEGNLYDFRRRYDSFDLLVGSNFSGLADVLTGEVGIAKLNAPNMRFVTAGAEQLSPVEASDFDPIQSFAVGGLANAWGAGLYRFVEADLDGFPIRQADLDPYFDRLTDEIGISGEADDLAPQFGDARGLQPSLQLSHNAGLVLDRYLRRRQSLVDLGVSIGRPRLGVLSIAKDGRPPCDYSNLEFWQVSPHIYTPPMTLNKLSARGQVEYRPGVLVTSWSEGWDGVVVEGVELETGEEVRFTTRRLILAAGAINTSRIVLQSSNDCESALPMLENPAVQIPFVLPESIGRRLDTHAFGLVQLNLIWNTPAWPGALQGSIMELTSPMRAEFFGRFPLSARANLGLLRDLLPAMLLMQLFFPGRTIAPARIGLNSNGSLRITGSRERPDLTRIRPLLGLLRRLGLWTHPALIVSAVTGHAIHYAATLPMREQPGRYECDPAGRLAGTRNVFIADSSCFSDLPAKNMSFAMMANAMRVATLAAASLPAASPPPTAVVEER